MNPSIYVVFFILIMCVILPQRRQKQYISKKIISKKSKKERTEMVELAKRFVDKECIITTLNSQMTGVIKEVTEGAILVENNSVLECINLDFVICIKEYPRKKNGKKKALVID